MDWATCPILSRGTAVLHISITEEQACLESVSDDEMQPVLQESTSKSELLNGSTGSVV